MKILKYLEIGLALTTLTGLNLVTINVKADASTLYVGSFNNDSVLRFDGETGQFIDIFVSQGDGGLDGPVALTFSPNDGNLYAISLFTASVLRYGGETGAFIDEFIPQQRSNLFFPQDLTFGSDNNLYITNTGGDTVNRYDGQTGSFTGALFPADEASCNAPFGVTSGPDRNLYFSCTYSNSIRRYDTQTGEIETLATIDIPRAAPGGLTFGPDGNLYVANFGANNINRYNSETGELEVFVENVDSPVQPIFGSDGNLYVSSNPTQKVGEPVPGKVLRYDGQTAALIDEFIPENTGGLDGAGWLAFTDETIPSPVPEPSSTLGLLTLGTLGTFLALKRRQKQHKSTDKRKKSGTTVVDNMRG